MRLEAHDPRRLLRDLFSFGHLYGTNDVESIEWLHGKLAAQQVTMTCHELTLDDSWLDPRSEMRWLLGPGALDERKFALAGFAASFPHQTLCAYAASWLSQHGSPWAAEADYPGGRADVVGYGSRRIAVECGFTKADKAKAALDQEWCFAVLPYSRGADHWLAFFERTATYQMDPVESSGAFLTLPVLPVQPR